MSPSSLPFPRPVSDYVNRVLLSYSATILVEGGDDKQSIDILLAELELSGWRFERVVNVDSAESLASPIYRVMDNRDKVRFVVHQLKAKGLYYKATGLIDRDHRGFSIERRIADRISRHRQSG